MTPPLFGTTMLVYSDQFMALMTAYDGMDRITASHIDHKNTSNCSGDNKLGFIFTDGIPKTIFAAF
jgi:hypothetical protein